MKLDETVKLDETGLWAIASATPPIIAVLNEL
jgi:hypothetical protein